MFSGEEERSEIKEEMNNGKVIMRRLHLFESWDVRLLKMLELKLMF
jgi:hypothetical protein